jgi:hypothetical protein
MTKAAIKEREVDADLLKDVTPKIGGGHERKIEHEAGE